ncbi:MAG: hypothetical protein ACK5PF_08730, partial [bacterium]
MAQRHAARITNQRRDLVAVLERLREHASTREAGGAEDGELHRGFFVTCWAASTTAVSTRPTETTIVSLVARVCMVQH